MLLRWKIAQWFELRWWKNYLSNQDKSAYLSWKQNYWKKIIEIISATGNITPDKKIIDFGCGPSGIFIALPQNSIVAVDPLIDEYEKQIPFFRKEDYHKVTFIKSTIEEFEISALQEGGSPVSGDRGCGGRKFDFVFCMNAINHVHDIEKGFQKLKEVCAGDGAIIISIDAHNFSFLKYIFRLIPGDILHPHQYDLTEYKKFLAADRWQIANVRLLKKGFVFNHYLLMVRKTQ